MAGERRIRYSAEQWWQFIEEQRGSGQSQAAFCEARGLGESTFHAWKRRLYGKGTAAVPALFTPLTRPAADALPRVADAAVWTVELELGGGLCLRLRRGA